MPDPSIRIGGPSYGMTVDARHAGCVASLSCLLARSAREVSFGYEHGTPVEVPRNSLFKRAMDEDVDVLLWLDSDCYWPAGETQRVESLIRKSATNHRPFVSAPVRQRNGQWNVWADNGERIEEPRGTITNAHAVGLGFGIFYLPWFRKNWPGGPWFYGGWVEEDSKMVYVSEDYSFCRMLSSKVPIIVEPLNIVHAHRGEK